MQDSGKQAESVSTFTPPQPGMAYSDVVSLQGTASHQSFGRGSFVLTSVQIQHRWKSALCLLAIAQAYIMV